MTTTAEIPHPAIDDRPSAAELLRRLADLRPLLRAEAARAEADRRVPDEVVEALRATGVFRIMQPRRWGGLEADFTTFMEVSEEIGRGDGSAAWVTALMNVCCWMVGLFPEQAQRDVWGADPEARVCGVLAPAARVRAVDGGQVVSGSWGFASGSAHAQWAVLGIPVVDAAGAQVDQGLALIPMSELTVKDTWFVAGLRATASNTLVADEVFVPAHRILSVPKAVEGEYGTEHTGETLYRSAFVPVLALILVGPQIGMARAALDVVMETLTKRKPISYTFYEDSAAAPTTQLNLAEAVQLIDTAHLHAMRAAADIDEWASSAQYMDRLTRTRVRMDTGYIARRCREAIDLLVSIGGASSFGEKNPLQRIWRDQETGSRHAVVNPSIAAEVYGRELLGQQEQVTALI
ncbi:Acyl-CoA dehydrogenase [Pseudonocardia thermophila]|uniref:Acyl-CoA dehydrogenase n=1 Tax=Pseudonocardia thermophila TaxID=1848 RepID=A0A1M6V2Z8_PSETH|nr:acyl-CoA dehydrogenase family protein [Pseudonocardia thermophila]SHK75879.1 Acyl-CoA dehydrogenase [Pseudonocardia thermophila]